VARSWREPRVKIKRPTLFVLPMVMFSFGSARAMERMEQSCGYVLRGSSFALSRPSRFVSPHSSAYSRPRGGPGFNALISPVRFAQPLTAGRQSDHPLARRSRYCFCEALGQTGLASSIRQIGPSS
jgi:hypothetical protein